MRLEDGKKYYDYSLSDRIGIPLVFGVMLIIIMAASCKTKINITEICLLIVTFLIFIIFIMFPFSYFTFDNDIVTKTSFFIFKKSYLISEIESASQATGGYGTSILFIFLKKENQEKRQKNFSLQYGNIELFDFFCDLLIKKSKEKIDKDLEYFHKYGLEIKYKKGKKVLTTEGIKSRYGDDIQNWNTIPCSVINKKIKRKYIFELDKPFTIEINRKDMLFSYEIFINECVNKCKKN